MITGAGSRWTSSNLLEVGASGRGDLTISDGGSLAVASLTLGVAAAGVGAAAVSGVDSQLRTTGNISVAALGNGSLTVADGAELYVGGGLTISDPAGAPIGTFRLDGGATYINGSAGFVNNGVFQHVDGLLQTRGNFRPNATNGELTINGTNVNDMPTVELVGSGPVENVTNVNVGLNRSGRLIVRNGRQLNIGPNELNIGGQVSGSGSVTVGPDSTIATNSSGSVNVGGIGPFSGGWGILNIHTGAIVDVGALRLFSAGTINLDGGLLAFDALGPLDGVVHWNAGTVRFDAATELTASLLTTWLGGDRTLRAGRTIASPQTLTLRTGMTVDGGSVNVATLAIAGGAGAGVGAGQLEIRSGIVQG
ncbi:MAG TPA: hypothetical protein PKC18_14655, partial [Lacipirellulaceae bacterium]|nr:hypothetical protein [Lacipirellulaceae bacterium]